MNEVVLLGGGLTALSAARALGRRGVRVHALSDTDPDVPAADSRFVHEFVDLSALPDDTVRHAWRQWLDGAPPGTVVFPCSDDGLEFVANHHVDLVASGLLPIAADWDRVLLMLDKASTYQLAAEADVPTPRFTVPSSLAEVEAAAAEFRYPCAIKPLQSHIFRRYFPVKMMIAQTRDELLDYYRATREVELDVMVIEMISDGNDEYCSYYTYVDVDGKPLVHFTKRKLRQWPVQRGIGSYHVSQWVPEAAETGWRFAQRLGLRGIVNVEFKRDGRDGRLNIIECNARITAANELVRRAGIDLTSIAYDRATGRSTAAPDSFREGVCQWLPLRDLRALREYRARGELTTAAWCRSLLRRKFIPTFAYDDPMPLVRAMARRRGAPTAPRAAAVTADA